MLYFSLSYQTKFHKFIDVCCLISGSVFKDHSPSPLRLRANQDSIASQETCQHLFFDSFEFLYSADPVSPSAFLIYHYHFSIARSFFIIFEVIRVVGPFIGGIVIAFILYKPAHALERLCLKSEKKFFKNNAKGISVLSCYLALVLILAVMLYLLLPRLFGSAMNLVQNLPTYYNSAIDYLKGMAGADGKVLGFDLIGFLNNLSIGSILSFFDVSSVGKYAGEIVGATGAIVDIFMAFVVSIYVLLGKNHLIKVFKMLIGLLIPRERIEKLGGVAVRSSHIFYGYIYSQLIDSAIVSVILTIVFVIIGLPYALLLGIIMGLCNIIPYFGSIIGGVGVVLVTLISSGDILKAVIALVCIIVVQQLDANLIQPRIVAESVGLRPIYVLLAIMIGSGLFGFVGILISVPVMAVIRMLIVEYIKSLGGKDTPIVEKQKELASEKEG